MPEVAWSSALEIQSLEHARTLLSGIASESSEIILRSPERALSTTGSRYWLAMLAQLRSEFPKLAIHFVIDAADAAGHVQGAIADGHFYIRFTGSVEVKEKLQQIANETGSIIL